MPELAAGIHVSRETEQMLQDFEAQLVTWSKSINLISRATYDRAWERHILDSAQLLAYAPSADWRWLDIGSGGGLPGLVIAILTTELRPNGTMTLVESDGRKAAFLKLMIKRYGLNATAQHMRVEGLEPANADIVSARAFSSLGSLVALAYRHLGPKGIAIFPKGRSFHDEIAQARAEWRFSFEEKPSIMDPEARILLISDIETIKGSQ